MSAAPLKVLVVDDEPPIRKLLRMGLSTQGYEILDAPSGRVALELVAQKPDLIILDLGLPDIEGLELLRIMRQKNEGVPIVVLSSRGDEAGKVQALDLGADDYVTKPFGMDELLARIRAALRHQLQVHGERPVFRVGDLSVDLVRRIVRVGDKEVKLSPKEYDLLRILVQHAGKVLTHKFLLKELWSDLTDAQYLRGLCPPAAAEDRAEPRTPALYPHRDRHRLSPARAGVSELRARAERGERSRKAIPMDIKDFLAPADAMIDVRASDKARLLQELARRAAAALKLPDEHIAAAIKKREEIGSTGMGDGIALPHARLAEVKKPFGMLVRLRQAVDFDAVDGKPVSLVFLLLAPSASQGDHLNALACAARALRNADVLQRLRAAASNAELYAAITSTGKC